jgi:inorganic phosphate transporter, PiT family
MLTLLFIVIVLALVFDFINGFHDAANSIATVVSTRVLTPFQAVLWAAFFNFLAYFLFELHVADTVSKTVKSEAITLIVVTGGLIGAIIWNLLTWKLGIPSSSSHTLMGGFAGAALAHMNWDFGIVKMDKITPVLQFILLAPLIGALLSYTISLITMYICRKANPRKVDKVFRALQLVSSAAFSLGHGGNDAQKVVGIIAAALITVNKNPELAAQLPDFLHLTDMKSITSWLPITCYVTIAAGTMMGGWSIVKTMGQKVTKLTPFEGFSAETAGAITLFSTGSLGIPVSTTHTITGSIIGTGILKRVSSVHWGVTINLIWAWILTIPVSAIMGAVAYYIISALSGMQ